jgi:predicted ArsR family transcriptional regulator
MSTINRSVLLKALIKHETLTIDDIAKKENLGIEPNAYHLKFLLAELCKSGHILILSGARPCTYTITDKGIEEGTRLNAE